MESGSASFWFPFWNPLDVQFWVPILKEQFWVPILKALGTTVKSNMKRVNILIIAENNGFKF